MLWHVLSAKATEDSEGISWLFPWGWHRWLEAHKNINLQARGRCSMYRSTMTFQQSNTLVGLGGIWWNLMPAFLWVFLLQCFIKCETFHRSLYFPFLIYVLHDGQFIHLWSVAMWENKQVSFFHVSYLRSWGNQTLSWSTLLLSFNNDDRGNDWTKCHVQ